ncbi:histidine phosphatase family protein [Ruthenibacterium lactatiformans]|uniref:histidine phosphatase family protein n=1 Tax=Ruthenibacterium lactatiformans TaxID=1550024 RepID=UPI0039F611CE
MKVYLLRHGQTEYNVDKRYQGTRDIPLSEKGRAALRRADIEPDTVYVSPLCRAVDTARVLFPAARLVPVHDLREMCFGIFEGRNYVEMERDPDYLAWVGDDCMGRCPGGERGLNFPTGPARPLRPWWTKRWRGARKCSSSWRTAAPRWR